MASMKTSARVSVMAAALAAGLAGAAEQKWTLQEPFGLSWGPDRVTYAVEFPGGDVRPDGVALHDEAGQAVPVQLDAVELWPDGKSVKSAQASFMVSLAPEQSRTWTLTAGRKKVRQPASELRARRKGGWIELSNSRTGIRLVGGGKTFKTPVAGDALPAPIQGVRLPGDKWIGKGWWETDIACTSYRAEITADGPVFARAAIRYDFEGGKSYTATVELNAGQDLAVVTEEYDLSEGQRYPMSGVDGMRPDERYAYVRPAFESPDKALMWDWWGQTMAKLPTPNAYCFSFHDGFEPDSADFEGRSQYGNLKQGDGGLAYDKDGRFAYLNAYLQWGDEETLYLGVWNAKSPAQQLAFVALRPSQWLHPDIAPHPSTILKQYVQTTCPTFFRKTAGDAWMRAPVCLGRRVYGIGGVERTLAKQVLPERGGPKLTEKEQWGSNLMLRHIRLGSVELDDVRTWTVWYDEPGKYPRMYVPEGDRARYESRRTRKPLAEAQAALAAQTEPTAADRKAVEDAVARLRQTVQHFAQAAYGHMDYGINLGLLANAAEDALASPACTPEQARDLRRWMAAIVYHAVNPNFVPPRTAGFAWGSANMMAQVQCRSCYLVALLPNHPAAERWRTQLGHVVTLYAEDQINEAGATLECPHYGQMAIMMPAHALAALGNGTGLDLGRAEKRFRAAAQSRLSILLPWDVRGGMRPAGVEGDGYYEADATFAPLAGFFQTRDPQLARQLAWGLSEGGNQLGGHADASFKMVAPGLEPLAPELGSVHLPGFGFVMRNGFPRRDEAYLQVYAGGFSWGHGHTDRGSWLFYAMGAPLMVDFAAMYTPSMREQWMHPGGLTFNHDETVRPATDAPENDWWRLAADPSFRDLKTAPFTVVEMREDPRAADELGRFGVVTAFRAGARADYARMERRVSYLHRVPYALQASHGTDAFHDFSHEEVVLKQPFHWTRQYVFVKDADPMGHNYLVVRDSLDGNTELDPSLNLWCLADKLDISGQVAVYTGQHGVNLHSYIAEPAGFTPHTRTVGHPCGFAFAQPYQKTFGKPFREDQIQLRIPQARRDGGYFVAIVPVKQGDPAPRFATVAGGQALQIAFADGRTDTILLRKDPAEMDAAGQKVRGAAVLVSEQAGKTTVDNLAAD
ncbi:MAG: hypothetical protein BWZ02_02527 [Lentisphaerae bacterium ADurb.BinA184]|nr:MAG: hypothetical protein BWZ02_02527 [Lentisphaerae bacterium ADurb.BinA184]